MIQIDTTGWFLLAGGWAWFGFLYCVAQRTNHWSRSGYRAIFKLAVLTFIIGTIWHHMK